MLWYGVIRSGAEAIHLRPDDQRDIDSAQCGRRVHLEMWLPGCLGGGTAWLVRKHWLIVWDNAQGSSQLVSSSQRTCATLVAGKVDDTKVSLYRCLYRDLLLYIV